ncbi:MAG: pilus assembly protein N-terminal domain-containing protein [Deltaproteobacteria bacterium]|nr:pilus assembly protein N-terminal domain-containing protein [Deltaproteobacteria bacterium]
MSHPFTKNAVLFTAFLALGIFFSAEIQAQKETLKAEKTIAMRLATGITETLDFDFSPGNIALGDPQVLRFQVDREARKMILVPLKVGKTSLDVYDQTGALKRRYLLTVFVSDLAKTAKELQDLLGEIEGIRIKIFGRKILIDLQRLVLWLKKLFQKKFKKTFIKWDLRKSLFEL